MDTIHSLSIHLDSGLIHPCMSITQYLITGSLCNCISCFHCNVLRLYLYHPITHAKNHTCEPFTASFYNEIQTLTMKPSTKEAEIPHVLRPFHLALGIGNRQILESGGPAISKSAISESMGPKLVWKDSSGPAGVERRCTLVNYREFSDAHIGCMQLLVTFADLGMTVLL